MAFEQICIVGTGLIGGSIGLALKRQGIGKVIVGVDRPEIAAKARERGAVDAGVPIEQLAEAVKIADLVILATPVKDMLTLIDSVSDSVREGALVLDTAVTKRAICSWAKTVLPEHAYFVGSHPMTGGIVPGIAGADARLLENALWVVCPDERVPMEMLRELADMIRKLGARTIRLSPKEHDLVSAAVGQVPQIVSIAMLLMAEDLSKELKALLALSGGGFRDLTRGIGFARENLKDVVTTNRDAISLMLRHLSVKLQKLEEELSKGGIDESAARATRFREAIPAEPRGFLPSIHDVFLTVPNQTGILAKITRSLADAGVNIAEIEAVKVRHGQPGNLRLGFDSAPDAERAGEILADVGYHVKTST